MHELAQSLHLKNLETENHPGKLAAARPPSRAAWGLAIPERTYFGLAAHGPCLSQSGGFVRNEKRCRNGTFENSKQDCPIQNCKQFKTTPRGFKPLRAEPNGFLVHHLNHSVTVSLMTITIMTTIKTITLRPCQASRPQRLSHAGHNGRYARYAQHNLGDWCMPSMVNK